MSVIRQLENTIRYQSSIATLSEPIYLDVHKGNSAMDKVDIIYRRLKAVYVSFAFFKEMQKEIDMHNHHKYYSTFGDFMINGCPVYLVKGKHPDFELVWQ